MDEPGSPHSFESFGLNASLLKGVAELGFIHPTPIQTNLVHRKSLAPAGVTFRANRIDKESEFPASSDLWFRPVNFAQGPDGDLSVIAKSRECIEHPESIPEAIKKHQDLTSGKEQGRIWRVRKDGAPVYVKPALEKLLSSESPAVRVADLWSLEGLGSAAERRSSRIPRRTSGSTPSGSPGPSLSFSTMSRRPGSD